MTDDNLGSVEPWVDDTLAAQQYAAALQARLAGEDYHWLGPDRVFYTVQPTPESLAEASTVCDCAGCHLTYGVQP